MKVIIITSSYPLHPDDSAAAAGLFVRDFALEAARQGHGVRVLTQQRSGRVVEDPELSVTRYSWSGDKPLSSLKLADPRDWPAMASVTGNGYRALKQLVAQERPDLLVAMWAVPAGLMARQISATRGIPYLVWVLGSDIWRYGRVPLTRWVIRLILRGADRVFADGPALAEETEAIASRPCGFLPSSRNLPTGTPRPPELDPGLRNFLFIGRFHENKGADLLIEAIAGMEPEERRNLHFFLFGKGPQENRLKRMINTFHLHDTVSFMGYADRLRTASMLEHCHALVVPSRIESIPLILSDAARAGCPAVVTDVGDMGLLVRRHGNGIAVMANPESIRRGILRMAKKDRNDFAGGCAGLAGAFSLEVSVSKAFG